MQGPIRTIVELLIEREVTPAVDLKNRIETGWHWRGVGILYWLNTLSNLMLINIKDMLNHEVIAKYNVTTFVDIFCCLHVVILVFVLLVAFWALVLSTLQYIFFILCITTFFLECDFSNWSATAKQRRDSRNADLERCYDFYQILAAKRMLLVLLNFKV